MYSVEDLTSCSESPLDLLVPRVHREHQARLNDNIAEDQWEIKAFARTTNDDDVPPHAPKMRVLLWEDFQGLDHGEAGIDHCLDHSPIEFANAELVQCRLRDNQCRRAQQAILNKLVTLEGTF